MPEHLSNLMQVVLAAATLVTSVAIAYLVYRVTRQQTKSIVAQSLNSYDFELHKLFVEYPNLRRYFYQETEPLTQNCRTLEEEQQLRAAVGFLLDYFHLLVKAHEDKSLKKHVDPGYIEWVQHTLATVPVVNAYLEQHRHWESWYTTLAEQRAEGTRTYGDPRSASTDT